MKNWGVELKLVVGVFTLSATAFVAPVAQAQFSWKELSESLWTDNTTSVSYANDISTSADMNALNYCDETGSNCFTAGELQTISTTAVTALVGLSDVSSTMAPADGEVLTYNNGTSEWEPQSAAGGANLWTDNTTYISNNSFHTIDVGQTVSTNLSGIPNLDVKTAFWYPDKAAFRVGSYSNWATEAVFADGNIGNYSVAFGLNNFAVAPYSFSVGGENSIASGASYAATIGYNNNLNDNNADYSMAIGADHVISQQYSVALGYKNVISDSYSFSSGRENNVGGASSGAVGYLNAIHGDYSFSTGYNNNAGGSGTSDYATAFGINNEATGRSSIAIGNGNIASNQESVSIGLDNSSTAPQSVTIGNSNGATTTSAIAIGKLNSVSGVGTSVALGYNNVVSTGTGPIAIGTENIVTGDYSLALGRRVTVSGAYSVGVQLDSSVQGTYDVTDSNTMAIVGGEVGIGTVSPGTALEVNGTITTSAVILSSDRAYKKDVEPLESALDKVKQLRGIKYFYDRENNPKKDFSDEQQIGLIAQEVEVVFPQVVQGKEGAKAVNYAVLVAPLIEAVKELSAKVDSQQQEIDQLKHQLQ